MLIVVQPTKNSPNRNEDEEIVWYYDGFYFCQAIWKKLFGWPNYLYFLH